MAYSNLFVNASQSAAYAAARPTYPPALYGKILEFLGKKPALAVDVATGTGQVIHGLHEHVDRVIGTDVSAEQLAEAPQFTNVEYRRGDAHKLPVQDDAADLVTVGQALHWLDRPRFYAEAARVLHRGGVLAAWCYGSGNLAPAGGAADKVYQAMLHEEMGPYWAAPRLLVENKYRDIEPMSTFFKQTAREEVELETSTSVDGLVTYVSSWSAYITYKKTHPDRPDPIIGFKHRLEAAVAQDGTPPGALAWTLQITLLMGKSPIKL